MKDLMILCGFFFVLLFSETKAKWVEGHIKTTETWSFLSRFCFLSLEGQFEYLIEFDKSMGVPNLLLYYDDESQWPSVYNSDKSCKDREKVLNKAGQNQIIPLSYWYPESEMSGCVVRSNNRELPAVKTTSSTTTKPSSKSDVHPNLTSNVDPSHFDQFLETTYQPSTDMSFVDVSDMDDSFVNTTDTLLWEPVDADVNLNDSDIKSNVKDVEVLFDDDAIEKAETNRVKRSLTIFDKLKQRGLNAQQNKHGGASGKNDMEKLTVICHNARRFRSARERWWFIAVSNCDSNQGLDLKYKFLMTNGPPSDFWHEHFSADEFYVLPVLLTFSVAYVFILLAVTMCTVELRSRHLLHSTYKLFVLSTVFQEMGIVILSCSYAKYGLSGVENLKSRAVGHFMCGMSEMAYLLLLILMAKGYTITRARLKVNFTIQLTVFMCTYVVTYVVLFVYQAKAFDPGEVLYLYESPAGYGLIVLRILAWFMFAYATVFTIRKYPEKGMFYFPFSVCGTLWFFAGPLFILTANYHIDKWVRESVVAAVLLFIAFAAHVTFLVLTLPTFANKNFPYHVRTTQIGIMQVVDKFPRGPYQPTNHSEPVIIPLSRRTEALIGTIYNRYIANASPQLSIENARFKNIPNGTAPKHDNENKVDTIENEYLEKLELNENSIPNSIDTTTINSETNESLKDDSINKNDPEASNAGLQPKPKPRNITKKLSTDSMVSNNSKADIFVIDSTSNNDRVLGLDVERSVKDIESAAHMITNPIAKPRRAILEPINLPTWSLAKKTNETVAEISAQNEEPATLPLQNSTLKKVPPVKNGLRQNSGEITTIIEGREHFMGHNPIARESTIDLFNAIKKV